MQNQAEINKKIDELKKLLCDCGVQTKSPSIKKKESRHRPQSRKASTLSQKVKQIKSTNANTICCKSKATLENGEHLHRYITNPDLESTATNKNCMETETVVPKNEAANIVSCRPHPLGRGRRTKKRTKRRTKRRYKKKKRKYKKKRTKKKSLRK